MDDKKNIPIPRSLKEGTLSRGDLENFESFATGGMSVVFKAKQSQLNRYVAIKSLKTHFLDNSEIRERFRREARALASILHQNVAHVYDFTETESEAFIFMEFIEGIDLSSAIQKVGALPAEIAAVILLGVARGVAYLHDHHLIHRDIKPSNIRLTSKGEVKLMDFGIVMDTENQALTRPGMMVGSPSYLSPEQVLGDPLTYQSDIFLLGICLYEMVTGTRPFKDEGNKTVFQRIRDCKYVPANEMNGSIPGRIQKMIERCLEKNPKDRYSSVQDLVQELEAYLGPTQSNRSQDILLKYLDEESLVHPAMPYLEDLPSKSRSWSGGWFLWGVAVFLLGFGFAAGFWLGQTTPTPTILPSTAKPIR